MNGWKMLMSLKVSMHWVSARVWARGRCNAPICIQKLTRKHSKRLKVCSKTSVTPSGTVNVCKCWWPNWKPEWRSWGPHSWFQSWTRVHYHSLSSLEQQAKRLFVSWRNSRLKSNLGLRARINKIYTRNSLNSLMNWTPIAIYQTLFLMNCKYLWTVRYLCLNLQNYCLCSTTFWINMGKFRLWKVMQHRKHGIICSYNQIVWDSSTKQFTIQTTQTTSSNLTCSKLLQVIVLMVKLLTST